MAERFRKIQTNKGSFHSLREDLGSPWTALGIDSDAALEIALDLEVVLEQAALE